MFGKIKVAYPDFPSSLLSSLMRHEDVAVLNRRVITIGTILTSRVGIGAVHIQRLLNRRIDRTMNLQRFLNGGLDNASDVDGFTAQRDQTRLFLFGVSGGRGSMISAA
jgi:hypothetical protein